MGSPKELVTNLQTVPDFSLSRLLDPNGQSAEEIKALLEKLRSLESDTAAADQLCRIFLGKVWLPIASTLWKLAEGEYYYKIKAFDKLLSEPPREWSDLIVTKEGPTFERIIRQLFPNCFFGEQLGDIAPGNIVMVYTKLGSAGYAYQSSVIRIFPSVGVVRIEQPGSDVQITPISRMSKLWKFGDGKYDRSALTIPETLESSLCGHGDKDRQLWRGYNNTIRLIDLKTSQG